ncbi:VapC toxin family PIN domain ribonuclease [Aphanothece cf. minutissima CCALA 015]|uniref:Ribonuclease VapC n=1 Tax=Aphanothece cf. minutissima CCALA 015 TaxID=2107695 RepID=A0ABX5F9J6_9CHRO|nr:VapC toxin family PIN domain ribonuclease [Aphanothece cf. minutissima CCALA 015]
MIVVDTNVVAYLLLPGPRTELAEALRRQDRQWAAPPLWRSEFRNVLTQHVRRDLLKLPAALALMQKAEVLLSAHEQAVASEHVLHLVSTSTCSSYDCEFVAAAQQLGVALITEDRAILAAFQDVAQSLHQGTS